MITHDVCLKGRHAQSPAVAEQKGHKDKNKLLEKDLRQAEGGADAGANCAVTRYYPEGPKTRLVSLESLKNKK